MSVSSQGTQPVHALAVLSGNLDVVRINIMHTKRKNQACVLHLQTQHIEGHKGNMAGGLMYKLVKQKGFVLSEASALAQLLCLPC